MENKQSFVLKSAVLLAGFAAMTAGNLNAQTMRITEVRRAPNGQAQVTWTGNPTAAFSVEASSDFANWSSVVDFPANTPVTTISDLRAIGQNKRFYRLRSGSASPNPVTPLPDLGGLPNQVFAAPDSTTTIQYAPDGKLAFVAWRDKNLIVRERSTTGAWSEYTVNSLGNSFAPLLSFNYSGPRNDFTHQPGAALVYDSQSRAHVFCGSGSTLIHYVKSGANFAETERLTPPGGANIAIVNAVIGANDVIHFATLSAGWSRTLNYGSNRNGSWQWSTIAQINEASQEYWAPPYAPRWLGLAVDSRNNGHIVFRPEMTISKHPAGYPRAYSELWYASNVSGSWTKQLVQKPYDISAEAANGASIAIGPDDKPKIVSWYVDRADTGSAGESKLYYHQQDGAGNWSGSVIVQSPDSYAAGDGPKGTGFSPQLKFDNHGRPHVVFLDAAGEHFSNIGQQEYAGNVRHAWFNGSSWSTETIYRQNSPLLEQGVYPSFAISGSEMAVTFVDRKTQWNLSSYPPMSNSTYYFRFFTKPLQ